MSKAKPYTFEIIKANGVYEVVRRKKATGEKLMTFRAPLRKHARLWLEVYLTLDLPNRRKLREACA